MKTKISIALGSLLGAAALHFVLAACGHGGTSPVQAQQTPTCTSWQTSFYFYSAPGDYNNLTENQTLGTQTIPAGWEPIGIQPFGGDDTSVTLAVALRKCASSQ